MFIVQFVHRLDKLSSGTLRILFYTFYGLLRISTGQWGNCVHNRRFCTAKGFHWHKRHIQMSKTFLTAQLEDKMVLV